MTQGAPSDRRRTPSLHLVVTAMVAAVILVPLFLLQDQRSIERGNRLFRSGDVPEAAEVYRGSEDRPDVLDQARYNLGTALLELDPDSAEPHLRRATQGDDRAAAQRGFYNLGFRFLTRGTGGMEPDSAITALFAAVASNRAALRLDPADQSARWNLALAQRRLDAMVPPDQQVERESSGGEGAEEIVIDDQSLTRSETADAVSGLEPEDPRPANNTGERQGAQEGAREAWASQDPGPMTRGDAESLLATVDDEAEILIRGILWSHRPDIAWWEAQPYPGGAW